MKVLYVLNEYTPMQGCPYVRDVLPARLLRDNYGYDIKFIILPVTPAHEPTKLFPKDAYDWADVVVLCRHYAEDIRPTLQYLKGRIPIVYETDDDLEALLSQHHIDVQEKWLRNELQCIRMITMSADHIVVSTPYLASRIRKLYNPHSPISVIYNHIDLDFYLPRYKHRDLRIGWSGGSTHPRDFIDSGCLDAVIRLQEKYDFTFIIVGISSQPLSAWAVNWQQMLSSGLHNQEFIHPEIWATIHLWNKMARMKKWLHVPFYPVQMYPAVLREHSFDIGVTPLIEDEFNKSRSCNKFYENAALGTVTIASDVIPYTDEVNYRATNNMDTWYDAIETLIRDKRLRKTVLCEQQEFVFRARDAKHYAEHWDKVFREAVSGLRRA